MLALHPQVRKEVNERFIKPILEIFFKDKKGENGKLGIEYFQELDIDKLKTEIEFQYEENYVQNYIYKEIITEIQKDSKGIVMFKPRYTISFDYDLTFSRSDWYSTNQVNYPYNQIFNGSDKIEKQIRYGTLRLGEAPILYVIFIDFQEVLRFIKKIEVNLNNEPEPVKVKEAPDAKKERLFDTVIQ